MDTDIAFDAVVFDLDGTLAATDRFWPEAARAGARRAFDELGIERDLPTHAEWMSMVGLSLDQGFEQVFADLGPREREVVQTACVEEENRVLARGAADFLPGVPETLAALPEPMGGTRVRVLSPFDPALRDRGRAERLFGFHYRIEIFVPAPKRRYGYYVFPVMEGDRLIGRIDMKSERDSGCLSVSAFWPERGVRMGKGRVARLEAELDRVRRIGRCETVRWAEGWLREG